MKSIKPPVNCPSCGVKLVWINDTLYCQNDECSSVMDKKIQHFAKTLKIKGLGPSTISKLELTSINDIYSFSSEQLTDSVGSSKIAEKLHEEIEYSKHSALNLLLAGFSIPLIGTTAASKLAQVCSSIEDISIDNCKKAGLGQKASDNLISWIELEFPKYKSLPFNFEFDKSLSKQDKGVVCITGKLKSYKTKAEATEVLVAAGYKIKDSVTKEVTILVNEGGLESSKTEKAKQLGITIVNNIGEIL